MFIIHIMPCVIKTRWYHYSLPLHSRFPLQLTQLHSIPYLHSLLCLHFQLFYFCYSIFNKFTLKFIFYLSFNCFHFKLRQPSIFPNCPCLVTYTLLCHKHVPLSHHSLNILFLYSLTGSSSSSNGLLLQKHSITTLLTSLFHIIIFIISFFKCCFDTIICQAFNLRPEQMKEYVPLFIDVIFQIERTFQST